MKPYKVIMQPVDRPATVVRFDTFLDALCLVTWCDSPCEVWEYETLLRPWQYTIEDDTIALAMRRC
jgi:hypothetical protein